MSKFSLLDIHFRFDNPIKWSSIGLCVAMFEDVSSAESALLMIWYCQGDWNFDLLWLSSLKRKIDEIREA